MKGASVTAAPSERTATVDEIKLLTKGTRRSLRLLRQRVPHAPARRPKGIVGYRPRGQQVLDTPPSI